MAETQRGRETLAPPRSAGIFYEGTEKRDIGEGGEVGFAGFEGCDSAPSPLPLSRVAGPGWWGRRKRRTDGGTAAAGDAGSRMRTEARGRRRGAPRCCLILQGPRGETGAPRVPDLRLVPAEAESEDLPLPQALGRCVPEFYCSATPGDRLKGATALLDAGGLTPSYTTTSPAAW